MGQLCGIELPTVDGYHTLVPLIFWKQQFLEMMLDKGNAFAMEQRFALSSTKTMNLHELIHNASVLFSLRPSPSARLCRISKWSSFLAHKWFLKHQKSLHGWRSRTATGGTENPTQKDCKLCGLTVFAKFVNIYSFAIVSLALLPAYSRRSSMIECSKAPFQKGPGREDLNWIASNRSYVWSFLESTELELNTVLRPSEGYFNVSGGPKNS